MKILVTGAAGFIGHALVKRLANCAASIVGIDNLNDYYDVELKHSRLKELEAVTNFQFMKADISDATQLNEIFQSHQFDVVVNLAAQAGVRYSIENPSAYIQANVVGFFNILEACRHFAVKHLLYASSSSVYGLNKKTPFSVDDSVDNPISLYAATKKSNELMAHTYAHLYKFKTTGLRFFTVYGPWGRPDMAMFKFTKSIFEGKPIDIYNNGDLSRDFTYIDDIVEAVSALVQRSPRADEPLYHVYNIGHGSPVKLMDFVRAVEKAADKKAIYNYLPMQAGDVSQTWADTQALYEATGCRPTVKIEEGCERFVSWFKNYYNV